MPPLLGRNRQCACPLLQSTMISPLFQETFKRLPSAHFVSDALHALSQVATPDASSDDAVASAVTGELHCACDECHRQVPLMASSSKSGSFAREKLASEVTWVRFDRPGQFEW